MAYQQIFRRIEKKYLLDQNTYQLLMDSLQDFVVPDKYPKSSIRNIYYDTNDHRLIRTSLDKPVYKEKFRVRCYGDVDESSSVFVELKKKYKGVVYKRRVGMTLEESKNFIHNSKILGKDLQIESEILYFLQYYNLTPAMSISYDRLSFCGKDDKELRITFDTNIIYRDKDLMLEKGVGGKQLLDTGQYVMEIKIPDSMPLWLAEILDNLKIYPTSFSKYGKAYLQTFYDIKKEKVEYYV